MLKKQQTDKAAPKLSRREREMMDIIFRRGEATVSEVRDSMVEAPSYSAVRSTLNILESKGHLTHKMVGNRYVYLHTVDLKEAGRSAMSHVLETFFDNSAADAVSALLEDEGLSSSDLERLAALVDRAKKEGR